MHQQSISNNYERNAYWDNVKGILILLVLLGHFIMAYPQMRIPWTTIYLFHMPAFLFVSGYFSSRNSLKTEKILKLIVLFLSFNIVLMVGMKGLHPQSYAWGYVYLSAWYLLALILYRLTIPFLEKVDVRFILLFSVCTGVAAGCIPSGDTLMMNKLVSLYFFFVAGYYCRHTTGIQYGLLRSSYTKLFLSILILMMIMLLGWYGARHGIIIRKHLIWNAYTKNRDIIIRAVLYITGALGTIALLWLTPRYKIPLITRFGANSLILYIVHRPIVQLLDRLVPPFSWGTPKMFLIPLALFLTLGICNLPPIVKGFNKLVEYAVNLILVSKYRWITTAIFILTCVSLVTGRYIHKHMMQPDIPSDYMMSTLNENQKDILASCFRISNIGDLVFLSPQIHRAYNPKTGQYSFDEIFTYTSRFFTTDDATIAVFEGPCAGGPQYTLTNYTDGKPVRLNYPDSLATAIAKAGIDFVTTANNHLLDFGYEGALRTLHVLDKQKIAHVGSYHPKNENQEPRHRILSLKNEKGNTIRVAVLAYTYSSNYVPTNHFFKEPFQTLTSCIVPPNHEKYPEALHRVEQDIERALDDKVDCLIIMPHIGTQFLHEADAMQKHWHRVFVNLGADIILSDHSHATQPCEWLTSETGKNVLVINCPGNYANSYVEHDGDASAITEIYLDKTDGKPMACGVIPLWTSSRGLNGTGQYIPAPLTDYITGKINIPLSNLDWSRLDKVSRVVTKSMLGKEIPLHSASMRYFTFASTPTILYRDSAEIACSTSDMQAFSLIARLNQYSHICFVGDSITEGTKNYGYGWFEPITCALDKTIKISRLAKGAKTSQYFLSKSTECAKLNADCYVMAYGTNDIRYRNPKTCAMTPAEYLNNIEKTVMNIRDSNPESEFIFIAPWTSYILDKYCRVSDNEKYALMEKYSQALKKFCDKNGHTYINPNPILRQLLIAPHAGFPIWVDDIYPNGTKGIETYSRAVLEAYEHSESASSSITSKPL